MARKKKIVKKKDKIEYIIFICIDSGNFNLCSIEQSSTHHADLHAESVYGMGFSVLVSHAIFFLGEKILKSFLYLEAAITLLQDYVFSLKLKTNLFKFSL